jgi:hypothetical protein
MGKRVGGRTVRATAASVTEKALLSAFLLYHEVFDLKVLLQVLSFWR